MRLHRDITLQLRTQLLNTEITDRKSLLLKIMFLKRGRILHMRIFMTKMHINVSTKQTSRTNKCKRVSLKAIFQFNHFLFQFLQQCMRMNCIIILFSLYYHIDECMLLSNSVLSHYPVYFDNNMLPLPPPSVPGQVIFYV